LFTPREAPPTPRGEKMRKEKKVGGGKNKDKKENRGKGNKLFVFYKLCFGNYINQIIIG
jgi:hypothetical protein